MTDDFENQEEAMLAPSRKAQARPVPAGPAIEPGDATAAISGQNEKKARRPVEDSAEGRRADLGEELSDRFGRCPHPKVECPDCHTEGCPDCERCDCEVGS